jgi:hypothetical protein
VRNDRRGPAFRCSPGRVRLTPGGVRAGYGAGGRRRPAGHRSRWSRQRYRGSQRCQACSVAVATHGSRTTRAVPGLLPLRAAVIVRDIRSGPPRPGGRSSPRPREVGYAGGARHPMRVREQVIGTLTCRSGSDPRRDLYHPAPLRRRPQPPADRASRRRRPRHGPHHQQQGGVTRPVVSTARAGQHGGEF